MPQGGFLSVRADQSRGRPTRNVPCSDGEDVKTLDNVREDLADGVEAVVCFEEGAVGGRCCAAV